KPIMLMRKFINTNVTRHVFFWIAYTLYFYIINRAENDNLSIGIVLLTVPYFAFVFYIVYHILEKFFRPEKSVKGVLSLFAFYILSTLFVYFVMHGGLDPLRFYRKIGRASCRERVESSAGGGRSRTAYRI